MKSFKFIATAALAGLTFACQPTPTNTPTTTTPGNNQVNANSGASPTVSPNANTPNSNKGNANGNVSSSSNPAGEAVQLADAGVTLNLPAGFKTKKEGADTVVTTPDGGVEIYLHVPADGTYEKAVAGATAELGKYVKNAKPVQQGEKSNVNGMDATSSNGSGTGKNGKPVEYDMTVLNAPKKPLVIVSYAEKESLQKHAAEIDALTKSIKKM